ncbi:hypothetical protein SO802_027459 [Lithocarpus litseifolius]|uniref:Uncharacterized protein n=1 Tax=Lithocarpus litseifolius TaxID=425828 RepID=A0AAW2C5R5_9ROSI
MSGPQCCSNPPTLNPNAGAGHVEQLGGLSTYVSGSPNSKLAILLISDVYVCLVEFGGKEKKEEPLLPVWWDSSFGLLAIDKEGA